MAIPDSPILQVAIIVIVLAVIGKFFRGLLLPLLLFLAAEIGLFLIFPSLLLRFVNLITWLHSSYIK